MTPERWQQVKELLGTALELDPAKRADYLDQACGNDPTLRPDLERLLAAEQKAGPEFLSDPVILQELTLELPPHPHAWVGRRLGAYEIVEEIGTGGMGEVYRAVRADDEYRKEVAIKLVRSGQDSGFVLSRFKNERQILASLDHPNIARLLDGGTTEQGVPYFVMELIQGERINKYCDARKLPTTDRLKLFLQVCSAVQYAHQHLVIHRDIKPGNILVTAEGVPKLLDFGIAKILESSETADQPEQTISLIRLRTPEYASPEQVKGEPITTTSDVYSLGVVLYELLAGRTPYDVPTRTPHEISRAVCEVEPEKPSAAVRRKQLPAGNGESKGTDDSALSLVREGSPEKLSKRLTGDLDNIVLMALRKEPRRRYATVEQFAQDIRRHLDHLPVLARKDTFGYRTSKFVTRHKVGVAVAALVTVALLSATGVTLRQARIARANEARAEKRFNDVRKLANSLMFEVHDSIRDLPGATAARKLIIQRAQEYLDSLSEESKSDPALLRELAAAYSRLATLQGDSRDANLGNTAISLQNYHRAIELGRAAVALDPQNPNLKRALAEDYTRLDLPLFQKGDMNGERECLREALLILEPIAVSKQRDLHVQYALGKAYELKGSLMFRENNRDGALEFYARALHINEVLAGVDTQNAAYRANVSFGHKHLGSVLLAQNHLDEALEHYRALSIDEADLAAHPDNLSSRYYITYDYDEIGHILGKRGDLETALSYFHKALDIRAGMAAADPGDTRAQAGLAATCNSIGPLLQRKGDYSGALAMLRKALHIREALAQRDPANERFRFSIAETQALLGELYVAMAAQTALAKQALYCREARPLLERSLAVYLQIQAEGKLRVEDVAFLEEIQKAAERCAQTIAPSGQNGSPPMPARPN
jgi:eukaryotic-like serine/threonine-protein kinase